MQVLSFEPMSSRYQQTPAHLAAYAGHPHCLQWLLNSGSDMSKKVNNDFSTFACLGKESQLFLVDEVIQCVMELINVSYKGN